MLVCFEVLYYCGMPFCLTSSIASAPSTSIVYTRMQSTLFFHKVCHVYFHPRKCFVLWTPDTSCAVACRKGLCLLPPPLYPSLIYSQLLPCCCQLSSKVTCFAVYHLCNGPNEVLGEILIAARRSTVATLID